MAKRCTTFLPRDGGVSADTLGARIRSIPLATSPHGSRTAACSFLPRWSLLLSQQRAFIQLNWGKRTQKLDCTPKVRHEIKGQITLNGGEQWICPDSNIPAS